MKLLFLHQLPASGKTFRPSIVCVLSDVPTWGYYITVTRHVFHLSFYHTVPPLILNLSTRWKWVVSLTLHSHLILREGVPCFHWAGSWVGPSTGMDIWRREKSLVPAKDQATIPWSNSIYLNHDIDCVILNAMEACVPTYSTAKS
jgi:hypothetical protein